MKKRYVVTKASKDKTFLKGDHIYFNNDGTISCMEAKGSVEKEDVEAACIGMEYELDAEWVEKQKTLLQARLDKLLGGA